MYLTSLLDADAAASDSSQEKLIVGLTADSREVAPGFLFAALPGTNVDGVQFVPQAVAAGAIAVLVSANVCVEVPSDVTVVRAKDPRRALSRMAAKFYHLQPPTTVAVTGTSGKSSVAEFTRQLFAKLGRNAASLGTIGLVRSDGTQCGALTTPDPVRLHATLAEVAGQGVTHLAFEASSHGLQQRRLDGVRLVAGAFTNLGHDHLDYHPTSEDYLAAKLRLFSTLLEPGDTAVINADGARCIDAIQAAESRRLRILTTGEAGKDLRLLSVEREGFNQLLGVTYEARVYEIRLPLVGVYQASNALVAAGLAIAAGEAPEAVLPALESLEGVVGRLQIVGECNNGIAVVDYAHKPDALEAVLEALRPFATGRLICVFGCGGDRDQEKRPIMGRIATQMSDMVIITDDNPRTENPAKVRDAILQGAPGAKEIADRGEAIAFCVNELGPGDVVVVAGKGHETGQIVGNQVLPFSDQEAVVSAIAARGLRG